MISNCFSVSKCHGIIIMHNTLILFTFKLMAHTKSCYFLNKLFFPVHLIKYNIFLSITYVVVLFLIYFECSLFGFQCVEMFGLTICRQPHVNIYREYVKCSVLVHGRYQTYLWVLVNCKDLHNILDILLRLAPNGLHLQP